MTDDNTARWGDLVLEIDLEHDPHRVWDGLTEEIGAWWPASFYSGGIEGARTFQLEAEPGGKMVERWNDGGGLLWGTVLTVEPGRRLEVTGHVTPAYGGPGMWIGEWTLLPIPTGTRLRFRESALGRIGKNYTTEKEKGWRFLFEAALGAHLDGAEPPDWVD